MQSTHYVRCILALVVLSCVGCEGVSRSFTAHRYQLNELDFNALLPAELTFGMSVLIDAPLPAGGTLFIQTANGTRVEVSEGGPKSDASNRFYYKPKPFAQYPAEDSVYYHVLGGNPASMAEVERGVVNISIINQPPVALPLSVKTVGRQRRVVNLNFYDDDEPTPINAQQYLYGESNEIRHVELTRFVTGNCTVWTEFPNRTMAPPAASVELLAPYRLIVTPPADDPTWVVGSACQFGYRVQDSIGAWSEEARVTLVETGFQPPRVFPGKMKTARVGVDEYVRISLLSSSGNGRSARRFYVKQLPAAGNVFVIAPNGTVDRFSPLRRGSGDILLDKGDPRGTRVQLAYQPPAPSDANGGWNGTQVVQIVWYVVDGGGRSVDAVSSVHLIGKKDQSGPLCGVTVLDPVFANKPYRRITLNYTIPEGNRIQRVALVQVPDVPLGDFYASSSRQDDSSAVALRLGAPFNDGRQHIFFSMRQPPPPFTDGMVQLYKYQVRNYDQQSCTGVIEVHFHTHDRPNTAGPGEALEADRLESCKLQHLTLLPLRGLANRTVAGGLSAVKGAVIIQLPEYGQLFAVQQSLPFQRGGYATLCDRINCTQYIDKVLNSGDFVEMRQYDPIDGLDSGNRIYVLYAAPMIKPPGSQDTFTYRFATASESPNTMSTALQRVNVALRDSSAETIYFWYDKVAAVAEQRVVLQLCNRTDEVVEVLPKQHGHGRPRRFRLFQFNGTDGRRAILGDEVVDSNHNGLVGMWVLDPLCRVVAVPSVDTHRRRFAFHMKRYTKKADGTLDVSAAPTYRVRIRRRNHPPVWAPSDCGDRTNCVDPAENVVTTNTVNEVPQRLPLFLVANDLDGDAITFVVQQAPRFGFLEYEWQSLSGLTLRTAVAGTRIQLRKTTDGLRDAAVVYYNHRPDMVLTSGRRYPVVDNFVVTGDDGEDSTPPLNVEVTANVVAVEAYSPRGWLSSSLAVTLAAAVSLTLLAGWAWWWRTQLARHRYARLPPPSQLNGHKRPAEERRPERVTEMTITRISDPEPANLAQESSGGAA